MTDTDDGFFLGDAEQGHLENIDRMGDADPHQRALARLNRDLVSSVESYLDGEERRTNACPVDALDGLFHGMASVGGTILLNTHPDKRDESAELMRNMMIDHWNRMVKATKNA